MSSLIEFTILNKTATRLEVAVRIVHPDEHYLNVDASFAMQILIEQYEYIHKEYIYNSAWQSFPFSQEEAKEKAATLDNKVFAELEELAWGKKITITEDQYNQISASDEWVYEGKKISSMGSEGNNFHLTLEPAYDEFCAAIEAYIEQVEVLQHEHYPHWFDRLEVWLDHQNYFNLPEALYEEKEDLPDPVYHLGIDFKVPNLLHHLEPGARWESAAYSFEGSYTQNYVRNYTQKQPFLLEPAAIEIPDEASLWAWWNSMDAAWEELLWMNYYWQKDYLFPHLTRRVLGFMVQPIFKQYYPTLSDFGTMTTQILEQMVQMKALFGIGVNLTTLEPIRPLKGLLLAEFEGSTFTDASPLGDLTELRYLNLCGCDNLQENLEALNQLHKMQYLYYDIPSQAIFDHLIQNMHQLKVIGTFLPFEFNAVALLQLKHLKRLNGYSTTLLDNGEALLEQLHQQGTEVDWELESGDRLQFKR